MLNNTRLAILLLAAFPTAAIASGFNALWNFSGTPDGQNPAATVTADAAGNLYTTTEYGGEHKSGTLVMLSRPAGSAGWKETILHNFSYSGGDGYKPTGSVLVSRSGKLFGTTLAGGSQGYGTVWQYDPSAPAGTNTIIIHSFPMGDSPAGGLVEDAAGNLYGTNANQVFDLMPTPQGGWAFSVLYDFTKSAASPTGNLLLTRRGSLLGVTDSGGTYSNGIAYELTPPAQAGRPWKLRTFWEFGGPTDGAYPSSGLSLGPDGALYGTTEDAPGEQPYGTLYRLEEQPDGTWTEAVTLSPVQGSEAFGLVAFDRQGNAYAVTNTTIGSKAVPGGQLFRAPPFKPDVPWTTELAVQFTHKRGEAPESAPSFIRGHLIGTTPKDGPGGGGTVYSYAP